MTGKTKLYLDMRPQPDETTCGPTCLHGVYRYFNDKISLDQVISEVPELEDGGTFDVHLARHALRRGYKATIYTYNLQLFDPTWFGSKDNAIPEKLKRQLEQKKDDQMLCLATLAYLDFLERGGRLRFDVLTPALLRKFLKRELPILSGLNATYLYNCSREYSEGIHLRYDDIRGVSTGHFVVLAGYDPETRKVLIVDPLMPNPMAEKQHYEVEIYRLICAIMLGIITYDANLLVIEPKKARTDKY